MVGAGPAVVLPKMGAMMHSTANGVPNISVECILLWAHPIDYRYCAYSESGRRPSRAECSNGPGRKLDDVAAIYVVEDRPVLTVTSVSPRAWWGVAVGPKTEQRWTHVARTTDKPNRMIKQNR